MSNEIVKKDESLPAEMMAEFEGYTGFENVDQSKLEKPFLSILHSTNDLVLSGKAKFGELLHTASGQVFTTPLDVVIIGYEVAYVEWEAGGGDFVAKHNTIPKNAVTNDNFKYTVPVEGKANNDLKETHYFYLALAAFPELGMMAFTLKSTGVKYAKKWISRALAVRLPNGQQAPIFSKVWTMNVEMNENDKGQKYYQIGKGKNLLVTPQPGYITKDLYMAIKPAIDLFKSMDLDQFVDTKGDEATTGEW